MIRVLVGLGLGLPILIELRTFLSLVTPWIGGDDGEDTPSGTPPEEAVGVGDELLPGTEPVERFTELTVTTSDGDTWPFTAVLEVENGGKVPYAIELGAVTTGDGTVVEGGVSSDRILPGETKTVATTWPLPEGATPRSVAVRAEVFREEPEVIEGDVTLRGVAVDG